MEGSQDISSDKLKKHCKTYDIEIIFHLDLSKQSLQNINMLQMCSNLICLVLKQNSLQNLSCLSSLSKLKYLDVAYNAVSILSNLVNLPELEQIKLEGNNINSWSQLTHLSSTSHFPKIVHISLQSFDGRAQNPICREALYNKNLIDTFSRRMLRNQTKTSDRHTFETLLSLDYRRLRYNKAFGTNNNLQNEKLDEWIKKESSRLEEQKRLSSALSWVDTKSELQSAILLSKTPDKDVAFQTSKQSLELILDQIRQIKIE
ncbi:Leucine Rich Repeat family protein [Reticulomyxa filosa]|uniref:Leucine Rich Repeat family protein n=1 Tax=Reticulomyxa filosa TaxID=46433 RepID=X6PD03_RETFI|nr:Leucine Rich Repeat family protein [Reticulomyxa filosa]|eukprot:ETO35557.1 Leucine Rich Repeat family protein [Reticulomyxa filosa]